MQLHLDLTLKDESTFQNFEPGDNSHLISWVKNIINGKERYTYLYGEQGVGKSHLLQAACHAASSQRKTSLYLPLSDHEHLSPHMLEGLEQLDLVCIDDIDKIAGLPDWEEALMHFYNRHKTTNNGLIITGKAKPNEINIKLKDLSSRLNWGMLFVVSPLNDEQKIQALRIKGTDKGMNLSHELCEYIIKRSPRSMNELTKIFKKLETSSLSSKRALTIPFAKKVLDL